MDESVNLVNSKTSKQSSYSGRGHQIGHGRERAPLELLANSRGAHRVMQSAKVITFGP